MQASSSSVTKALGLTAVWGGIDGRIATGPLARRAPDHPTRPAVSHKAIARAAARPCASCRDVKPRWSRSAFGTSWAASLQLDASLLHQLGVLLLLGAKVGLRVFAGADVDGV